MTIRQSDKGGDRISPKAIEIFKAMQELSGCVCAVMTSRCPVCDECWRLHNELHDELQLKPYQWPAIVNPDEGESVYPPESGGAAWHPQAKALWRELERRAAHHSIDRCCRA
ncbi:hypothetical protein [Bradyrhizobium manausense]|uniref:Uncharacterized protein n=1 Tax=Bradyrhizobium manausense TaxID=989370 RepID=A0A0R3CXV5_9BRAD|nr:hypothetical protein [Bradyrhizobium manausense]KRQ02410.1 hypothetical protein AOQ71_34890 [Bradyrhizobium manausense]